MSALITRVKDAHATDYSQSLTPADVVQRLRQLALSSVTFPQMPVTVAEIFKKSNGRWFPSI